MSQSKTPDEQVWQLMDLARALRQAHRRGDPSVCARIRSHSPRFAHASDEQILADRDIDARGVVCHEHGYDSFAAARESIYGHKFLGGDASLEHLRKQAKKMLRAFQDGDPATLERVRRHHHRDPFTLNDAYFVLAREHGFDSWPKLMAKLEVPEGCIEMSRPQLLALELMHDEACAGISRLFSRRLGVEAWCDTIFVDQTTYAEFIAALSRPGCLCSFAVEAMASRAVLDIAMPLTDALLGRSYAGAAPAPTPQELRALEPVFLGTLAEIESAWQSVLPTALHDVRLETDPLRVRVTEPQALVVLIGLEVCTTEIHGLVPVAYPVPEGLFELRQHFRRP